VFNPGAVKNTPTFQQSKAIIERVKAGNLQALQNELARFGVDPKDIFYDTFKQTPIFYCSLIKDPTLCTQIFEFLVAQGVDPLYRDTLKQTALYYACREQQYTLIKELLAAGCQVNNRDEYGQTPIYYACREGHIEVVRLLLQNGADVNNSDMHGQTCIYYAAKFGRVEVCQLLIEHGANFMHTDNKGVTPVITAHRAKRNQVVDLFVSKGAPPPAKKASRPPPRPSKPKTDKKEPKKFCLTKQVDGVWVPLTQAEIQSLITALETENPQVAAVLKKEAGALDNLQIPAVPDHVPIYDHWEKAAK
jgi:ankyrin repeat protein